jgi:hypothetical protein
MDAVQAANVSLAGARQRFAAEAGEGGAARRHPRSSRGPRVRRGLRSGHGAREQVGHDARGVTAAAGAVAGGGSINRRAGADANTFGEVVPINATLCNLSSHGQAERLDAAQLRGQHRGWFSA